MTKPSDKRSRSSSSSASIKSERDKRLRARYDSIRKDDLRRKKRREGSDKGHHSGSNGVEQGSSRNNEHSEHNNTTETKAKEESEVTVYSKKESKEANKGETAQPSRIVGAYIPPAKLKKLREQITDKSSEEYQRLSWEALRRSINGHINKVNVSNIRNIILELIKENLLRGKGLYCKCIIKAQTASPSFTPVYAALTAVINTKFPNIGELLIKRLISQFRKGYKRRDKQLCLSTAKFLACCVNQRIVHEILALNILMLFLEHPTDASIELAVSFIRDCGSFLSDNSPKAMNTVFDRLRDILYEGNIEKRTQYMIEIIFQVRRDKYKDNPAIPPGLDLVEDDDRIIHMVTLDDEILDVEEMSNVFQFDPNFLENEEKYKKISKEILGEEESEEGSDAEDEGDEESEEEQPNEDQEMVIHDQTDTSGMNFRREIYLVVMSSLSFEECVHKLLSMKIKSGQEGSFVSMLIECCSVERTYITMYGLVAERFCQINNVWVEEFTRAFEEAYKTIHRYEINLLRNIAKFFAHLLVTDAISWDVFVLVKLTEADTTSSSRIFLKIIFQDILEVMGINKLLERIKDPELIVTVNTESRPVVRHIFDGVLPKDNPKNTRFAINYFTSIGLGPVTEDLREHLKNASKLIQSQKQETESEDDSYYYTDSSYSYYSSERSRSTYSRSSSSSSR